MPGHRQTLPALLLVALAVGCSPSASSVSQETEAQMQEMDAQLTDLQAQLTAAQTRAAALSGVVSSLEASVADLDRRVLDLSGGGDIQMLRPEVEAAVAVVKQRVGEVRQASSGVEQSLAPE
jgi:septal ring factor EnvC (AmiA/AmiB activator)